MDIILYVITALTLVTLVVTLIYYARTKALPYLHFAIAFFFVLASYGLLIALELTFASSLDKFTIDVSTSFSSTLIAKFDPSVALSRPMMLLALAYMLASAGFLAFELATLWLLGSWLASMQAYVTPNKFAHGMSMVRMLCVVIPLCNFAEVALMLLSFYVDSTLIIGYVTAVLFYSAVVIYMLAVVIWLALDVRTAPARAVSDKQKQIMIIVGLVFFHSGFYAAYDPGWRLVVSTAWLIQCLLVVWPGALVGYNVVPLGGYYGAYDVYKV